MCRAVSLSSFIFVASLVCPLVSYAEKEEGQQQPAAAASDNDRAHLQAAWRFNDAAATTISDSSKHGRHGTVEGSAALADDGRQGKALKLDGDGIVKIVGYKGVTGTQPRTVTAWIKTEQNRGEVIAWGEDDFGKMWVLGFVRGHMGVVPNGGYLYMNDRINDGRWHHVAAVVQEGDPPNLHDSVKLYVDGVDAEIHDIGLLDLWPVDTGAEIDVRIGRKFKGLIDDVCIYDQALGDEEIKALFEKK
jgi:hypothetical protein